MSTAPREGEVYTRPPIPVAIEARPVMNVGELASLNSAGQEI